MSGSVNKVVLIGNLGKDPDVKMNQFGNKIVTLSVATSESWKDKETGLKKERTEWHRVIIMNESLGDIASQYLKKGSKVYVEGQIQTRKWTDDNGSENHTTEIILPKYKGELVMIKDTPTYHVGGTEFSNEE